MKVLLTALTLALAIAAGAFAFVYSGAFDAAADRPHSRPVYWLVQTARERSIARRAADIKTPKLDDAALIAAGAGEYAEMCSGCHLAPGMEDNEFRAGLYPAAPELAKPRDPPIGDAKTKAAREFWIVKHGIKLSAMPAWGKTHDDQTLWSIVAFLQKLPQLTPEQYAAMTEHSAAEHDAAGHEHAHSHGDEHAAEH